MTLQRTSCLGYCPDYEVTISGDGHVRYHGNWYVAVKGTREATIPAAKVKKLMKTIEDSHFFDWPENKMTCLDLPEVHITVKVGNRRHHVFEGCSTPGKILNLASEIDRIAGTGRWTATAKHDGPG